MRSRPPASRAAGRSARRAASIGLGVSALLLVSPFACLSLRHSARQLSTKSADEILVEVVEEGRASQLETVERLGEAVEALSEVARAADREAASPASRLRAAAEAAAAASDDGTELLVLVEDSAADLFTAWGSARVRSDDAVRRAELVAHIDALRAAYEPMREALASNVDRAGSLVRALGSLGDSLKRSIDADSLAAARGQAPLIADAVADLRREVDAASDAVDGFLGALEALRTTVAAGPPPQPAGPSAGSSAAGAEAYGGGGDDAP